MTASRDVVDLSRDEAMALVPGVGYGRLVFTRDALPAVRLVDHVVDGDTIIIRTRLTAHLPGVIRADRGIVVAYQIDRLDPAQRTGWSVVVTGRAHTVTDPEQVARYQVLLRPWVNVAMDTIIAIEPGLVTGVRFVAAADH